VILGGLDNRDGATEDMGPTFAKVNMPHRRRPAAALLLPILLLLARPAHAQYTEAQPGSRVRITAPGVVAGSYAGTVLAREPGIVRLGSPNTPPIDVPIDRITVFEISHGKSRSAGAGRGVAIGTPIGAVLGLVAASSDASNRTYWDYNSGRMDTLSRGEIVLYTAATGALLGAAIGALVPKERWERFDVAPRTGIDWRGGRTQLGLRLTY
jgi:hypothetical protein